MAHCGTALRPDHAASARNVLYAHRRSWVNRDAFGQAVSRARLALSAAHLSGAHGSTLDGWQVRENLEVLSPTHPQARLSLVWPSQGVARGDAGHLGEHHVGEGLSGGVDSHQR